MERLSWPTWAAVGPLCLGLLLLGCKSVPEVPPGRKVASRGPIPPNGPPGGEVGFGSAPPAMAGMGFPGGAPGSSGLRNNVLPPNPFDSPPPPGIPGLEEVRTGYQPRGLADPSGTPGIR